MMRYVLAAGLVVMVAGAAPTRAHAQVDQGVVFGLGHFGVRGEDARIADDVLLRNLDTLAFDVRDFNAAVGSGEWVFGVSRTLEAGVGLGIYRRGVPSVYREFVRPDGTEIAQDLTLRIVPVTAAIRYFPLGRLESVQPYLGGGLGLFAWRYTEVGEFVDFRDFSIFRDRFVDSGTSLGGLVMGGLRVPLGDIFSAGGELRYQWAEGRLDPSVEFLADRIDLGGWATQLTVGIRF